MYLFDSVAAWIPFVVPVTTLYPVGLSVTVPFIAVFPFIIPS